MFTLNFNKLCVKLNSKILDIGCGSGRHITGIYDLNIKNTVIIAVDKSFENLKLAIDRVLFYKKLVSNYNVSSFFFLADITFLPFKNSFFDYVICSEVLEHIKDDKLAIIELIRILKPGGCIVITVPRYFPEKLYWMLSDEYSLGTKGGHIRIYRKKIIKNLLINNNLHCSFFHYSHSIHTPFWFLKCLFNSSLKKSYILKLYHSFLVLEMMGKLPIISFIDKLLNPLLGKSLVIYAKKR